VALVLTFFFRRGRARVRGDDDVRTAVAADHFEYGLLARFNQFVSEWMFSAHLAHPVGKG